jgi:hypothetical protein
VNTICPNQAEVVGSDQRNIKEVRIISGVVINNKMSIVLILTNKDFVFVLINDVLFVKVGKQ